MSASCGFPTDRGRCSFEAPNRARLSQHNQAAHGLKKHRADVRARVQFDAAKVRRARTLAIDAGLDPDVPHTDAEVYRGIALEGLR